MSKASTTSTLELSFWQSNGALYGASVLFWGASWLAIKSQLGVVDPMLSVAYRFLLAGLILQAYCRARGLPMRFTRGDHAAFGLLGVLLFSLNYVCFYWAEEHLTSGLAAVIFSTVVVMNIFNARLFLRSPLEPQVLLAACMGLTGIGLVFQDELLAWDGSNERLQAIGLGFLATYCASLGNIWSARNQRRQLPVVPVNAYSMLYGGILMLAAGIFSGADLRFEWTVPYVSSLVFLSVFASVLAFGAYLTLLGRVGPGRAAYATLLFPLVALTLSTWFEGYVWHPSAIIGVGLILGGNLWVLRR